MFRSLPAFQLLCIALSVASCLTEGATTGVESELTPGEQLVANSVVVFSHDHVRDKDPNTHRSQHFEDARAGGVTAMTLELVVDNTSWHDGQPQEVFGPVGGHNGQYLHVDNFPFEKIEDIGSRFDAARDEVIDTFAHS